MPRQLETVTVFIVVMRCLDCELLTHIDSAHKTRADADARLAAIDKDQAHESNPQTLGEILVWEAI